MSCNLLAVIPGPLAKAMPIARHGTVGVATHHVPCSSHPDVQKLLAFKTKTVKSTFVNKSPAHSSGSHGSVHVKSRTRIGCWNVRTLGSLSEQSTQLRAVLDTMKSKNMDLLALAESRWPGSGVSSVCDSTILHSGSLSSHTHVVAVILSPRAKAAWDAAGCVFQPVSERILRLRLKCHMSYMTVVAVYAPINPPNSTSEAVNPLKPSMITSSPLFPLFHPLISLSFWVTLTLVLALTFPLGTQSLVLTVLESAIKMGNDCWTSVLVIS